jgi:hypothetical protein
MLESLCQVKHCDNDNHLFVDRRYKPHMCMLYGDREDELLHIYLMEEEDGFFSLLYEWVTLSIAFSTTVLVQEKVCKAVPSSPWSERSLIAGGRGWNTDTTQIMTGRELRASTSGVESSVSLLIRDCQPIYPFQGYFKD